MSSSKELALRKLEETKNYWLEKLTDFERELVIEDSAEKKFSLRKKIEECEQEIKKLEAIINQSKRVGQDAGGRDIQSLNYPFSEDQTEIIRPFLEKLGERNLKPVQLGRNFWLRWTMANTLGGASYGSLMGITQWLLLRNKVPNSVLWLWTTMCGWLVGCTTGLAIRYSLDAIGGFDTLPKWLLLGTAVGANMSCLMGLAQSYALEQWKIPKPYVWILTNAIAGIIAGTLGSLLNWPVYLKLNPVDSDTAARVALFFWWVFYGLFHGILTGVAMPQLFKRNNQSRGLS